MVKRKSKTKRAVVDVMDAPTAAQLENGSYDRRFVTHVETNTKAMAFVSDHDPVERWERAGRVTDLQMVAISSVRRLWALTGQMPKVTASYGSSVGQGNIEMRAVSEIEARSDLHRIQRYFPPAYWNVFENVCRWGMPAGVVGGELGFGARSAQDRAHQIVVTLADMIAMFERY